MTGHRDANSLRSGLITPYRPDCDPPHNLLIVAWPGYKNSPVALTRQRLLHRWMPPLNLKFQSLLLNQSLFLRLMSLTLRVLEVCGITNNTARRTFINIEGLSHIEAFGAMSGDTDVTEMAKCMAARSSAATGRVILGTMQIKRLQALVYWVKDSTNRGLEIDPDMWTPEEMASAMDRKESEYNYGKIDIDLIDPGKCQTDFAWDNWQIAFVNKLSATMGAAKFPIDYVVRPDVDDDYEPMDDDEERRYQIPLTGENFKRDNKLVYTLLKLACIKTDAWTWIQSYDRTSNGRQAWLALVAHYDGTGELNKRVETIFMQSF